MNTYQSVTDIEEFEAPWNKNVTLQNVVYEGGMALVRLRIKEGSRFTDLELAPETAAAIGRALITWASENDNAPG